MSRYTNADGLKVLICWPDPDATCVEGGCGSCEDGQWKWWGEVYRYCKEAGRLPNREGSGTQDALKSYRYGRYGEVM